MFNKAGYKAVMSPTYIFGCEMYVFILQPFMTAMKKLLQDSRCNICKQ